MARFWKDYYYMVFWALLIDPYYVLSITILNDMNVHTDSSYVCMYLPKVYINQYFFCTMKAMASADCVTYQSFLCAITITNWLPY